MKFLKTLLGIILIVAILFSIDFLGFYPVGKKAVALLKKTPLKGPIKTWELGVARQKEWEGKQELLGLEREELKKKEQELAAEQEELEAQRIRLEREAEQTANLIARLQKQENQVAEQKEQQKLICTTANLLSKMKPKQAARSFRPAGYRNRQRAFGKNGAPMLQRGFWSKWSPIARLHCFLKIDI